MTDSQPAINQQMTPFEWGLITVLSIIWGGTFFFAEIALLELRPFTLVLGRVGFAAITLWVIVYLSGNWMPASFIRWRAYFIMGALNNMIPFSLIV